MFGQIIRIILFLAVGLLAGWLGSKIVRGKGFGLVGNLVVGIIGAFIGGYVFRGIGLHAESLVGELIAATVGAIIVLFVVRVLKSA